MLKTGTLDDGIPWKPMTPATVTNRMKPIKRMASDIGFIGKGSSHLREIVPQDIIAYMEKRFPDRGFRNRNKWNTYARAFRTLGSYLHFEIKDYNGKPAWTKNDLELLRSKIKVKSERIKKPPTLSVNLIERWEKLLIIMRKEDPYIYAMASWSYYTCMRYDEIRKMDFGFETGSAILQPDGSLEVDGKKNKGEDAFRPVPVRKEAQEVLDWWINFRNENGITSPVLFPAEKTGNRRSVSSSCFNRRLRLLARKSGLFKGTCNDKGDKPTGELKLLKSHTMGRHAGATVLAHGKAGILDIQRQTGHRDYKKLDGYINIDSASVAERLQATRQKWNKNGDDHEQVDNGSLKDMIIAAIRELSPEEKKELGMEILKEVMS